MRHPTLRNLTPQQFVAMVEQTRTAGRGDVLGYRNVTKTVAATQPSEVDIHQSRMDTMLCNSYVN